MQQGSELAPTYRTPWLDKADHDSYCDLQIEMSGDGPLPQTEQPFHDDLGYGASIYVVAVKPRRPITWVLLKGIIQGLWDVLVVGGRYKVCKPASSLI